LMDPYCPLPIWLYLEYSSTATRGQIGWKSSSNGDGVSDILSVPPTVKMSKNISVICGDNCTVIYTGNVTINKYPNKNPYGSDDSITLDRYLNVSYIVQSVTQKIPVMILQGNLSGGYSSNFIINFSVPPGNYTMTMRATDFGNNKLAGATGVVIDNFTIKTTIKGVTTNKQNFSYRPWGDYYISGNKFAGYDVNSIIRMNITKGMDNRIVLADNNMTIVARIGQTVTLQQGYAFKVVDIDKSRTAILLSLLKNNKEVDKSTIGLGGTYIYYMSGNMANPLILLHVSSISVSGSGSGSSIVQFNGLFQISE
jgi:hypothetical protein